MIKKGEITKRKIYQVAKDSFYEKGYNETAVKNIASTVGISLGNMTYHFKTKDSIIIDIFGDYLDRIYEYADHILDKDVNTYYRHFFVSMIFYDNILSNPNNKKFYKELLEKKSIYKLTSDKIGSIYLHFIEEYQLRISTFQYKAIMLADFGARREVLLSYMSDDLKMPVKDLTIQLLLNTSKLLGIKEEHVFKAAFWAFVTTGNYDYHHIDLLK